MNSLATAVTGLGVLDEPGEKLVVAAGNTWLPWPPGAAWLAVHPRVLERGVPVAAGREPVADVVRPADAVHEGVGRSHCVKLADELLPDLGLPERGSAIVAIDACAERLARAGIGTGTVANARAGRVLVGFRLYTRWTMSSGSVTALA